MMDYPELLDSLSLTGRRSTESISEFSGVLEAGKGYGEKWGGEGGEEVLTF